MEGPVELAGLDDGLLSVLVGVPLSQEHREDQPIEEEASVPGLSPAPIPVMVKPWGVVRLTGSRCTTAKSAADRLRQVRQQTSKLQ
jgi:hypothetical protein